MNAPLNRSRYGKDFEANYDRIFGLEKDMNNQVLVKVEEAIRMNSFSLAKFMVESGGSMHVQFVEVVDKETGEPYIALSWSRDDE